MLRNPQMPRSAVVTNPLLPYSTAAHRASGIVNQMIVDGKSGQWVAIKLSDGDSDKIAYETKSDAIRHQLHEHQCAYVCIPPDQFSPRAAENYLKVHRQMYDAGYRLADPDMAVSPVLPQRSY